MTPLRASKDLQNVGIDAEHAEAIAMAIKAGQGELATKADIQAFKSDIQNLEKRLEDKISNLRWTVIVVAGVVVVLIKFLPV